MATAKEQLLSSMSPQMARLLDEQLAGQQAGAMAPQGYRGLVSTATQQAASAGNLMRDMFGMAPQRGLQEQQAFQQQQQQQMQEDAIGGATGKDRVQKLRNVAQRLREKGGFRSMMLAEQYESKADELAYKFGTLEVDRLKAIGSGSSSKGFTSTEGEHFRDEKTGDIFATVLTTNKDTGEVDVKYTNLTSPGVEYDGESTLVPVIKSGSNIGYTPKEAAELEAIKQGDVELRKEFSKLKAEAAGGYTEARSNYNDLQRALVLTKDLLSKGELQGGLQASALNLIRKLTGTTPKNIAELNNLFGEATYARLKPLFGGVISEGERQSIEDLYFSISKSGEVNVQLLERFIDKVDNAMVRYGILMKSDSFEDYTKTVLSMDKIETPDVDTKEQSASIVPDLIFRDGQLIPNPDKK